MRGSKGIGKRGHGLDQGRGHGFGRGWSAFGHGGHARSMWPEGRRQGEGRTRGEGHGRRGGGRMFEHGALRWVLLSLIADKPSHGYELIKALQARSNGFYSPSPGMVYPALTYLEELGYVDVEAEGNRKRYALAAPGREHLEANRDRVELMLAKLSHIARKMDSVRRAFAGEPQADVDEGGWVPELIRARHALKHALVRRDGVSAAEQRRIAAILERATREIEDSEGQ